MPLGVVAGAGEVCDAYPGTRTTMSSSKAAAVMSFGRMSLCSRRAPTDLCKTHLTSGSLRVTWSTIRTAPASTAGRSASACAKHLTRPHAFRRARVSDTCSNLQPLAAPCERVRCETRCDRSGGLLAEHAPAATAALARRRTCAHRTGLRSPLGISGRDLFGSDSWCFFGARGEVVRGRLTVSEVIRNLRCQKGIAKNVRDGEKGE